MPLRIARGDMYPFITHTWNPIKGKCPHGCGYCYVDRIARRFGTEQKVAHLDECELRVSLGVDNYIFYRVVDRRVRGRRKRYCICRALHHAGEFKNRYLLQSKHPERALFFFDSFPFNYRNENEYSDNIIFATTAETNRHYPAVMGNAPPVAERLEELEKFPTKTMVTAEPIMEFDINPFALMLCSFRVSQINIGTDSGHNGLPEPSADKVRELIASLRDNTEAKIVLKKNLRRILPEHPLYKE